MARPGLSEHGNRKAWQIAAAVLLLASVTHFTLEIQLILEYCCYDFAPAFKRVVGFATQGEALYPVELESYAPGVGDFKYPPLYALLLWLGVVAGLREVPFVPYLTVQVALYLASVALLVVAFGLQRRFGLALLFVVIALNFGPAFETLLRLQIEMPVLFCLAWAALCLQRGRSALAGWMLAAATMLKLYPALAILAFIPEGRRTLVTFGAGIVTVMLVSLMVLGPSECEHFFLRALPLMSRELPIETYHAENASVARWLMSQLGQSAETARLWGRAVAGGLVAASLVALRFRRQAEPVGGTDLALLVPVMLLALPNSWTNYQVLLLVPMAAMLGSACHSSAGRRLLQVGAVLLAGLWLGYHIDTNHYPLWLHLPPGLSVALHDNRVAVTLSMWAGVLWSGASAAGARGQLPGQGSGAEPRHAGWAREAARVLPRGESCAVGRGQAAVRPTERLRLRDGNPDATALTGFAIRSPAHRMGRDQMIIHRVARGQTLLSALVVAIALPAGAQAPPSARTPLLAFFDSFADEWMRRQPSASTGSRYFEGETQAALDRQLTPLSEAFQAETVALARRGLSELARYDGAPLRDAERVSVEVMRWQLQTLVDGWAHRDYQFPLQQMSGANVSLPNLMTVVHPVGSARDADNYLARLRLIDERMAEATELSAQRAARGIRPPRFILQATIAQMRQFVSGAPAANPLVATFAERLEKVPALDAAARRTLVAQGEATVEAEVYPAWRKAIAVLEAQLPAATDDAGLWRFPEGARIYADRLRQFTSTGLGAQEIHDIGLREVARLESEMDRILRSLGRTEGSVKERMASLKKDLAYPDDAPGRARLMADIETMIRDAERRSDALFDLRPKARVIAQPYPEYRWASAAASYTAPPLDGSRPGVYQMPLRPERLTRLGLRTLVYHETVPGHHFQVALSVENRGVPKFRQTGVFGGTSAFGEGWALYAERLAAEEGWYAGDSEGLLGQLDAELFRARRLVVDTGLHALRWTRQQAVDYGIEASEVERYVVMPGQATAYKIGQLEIIRLRDEARAALGSRFDPRQFHNRVLLTGSVPLTLLKQEVDAYVRSAKAAD